MTVTAIIVAMSALRSFDTTNIRSERRQGKGVDVQLMSGNNTFVATAFDEEADDLCREVAANDLCIFELRFVKVDKKRDDGSTYAIQKVIIDAFQRI